MHDEELLITGLSRIDRSIALGERLVIATINDSAPRSQVLFDRCKPGCPEVSAFEEMLSPCKRAIARRDGVEFRMEFVTALRGAFDEENEYRNSAILETIRMRSESIITRSTDRLIIFSDLLENSLPYPWPTIVRKPPAKILAQIAAGGLIPSLAGAEVSAFGLGRDHNPDRTSLEPSELEDLTTFWSAYFERGGAAYSEVGIAYDGPTR
jgi:hypothetical protein